MQGKDLSSVTIRTVRSGVIINKELRRRKKGSWSLQGSRSPSSAKNESRLQYFAGTDTLVTDPGVLTGEEAISLWIVSIVVVEAADTLKIRLLAKNCLIPGTALLRGGQTHLFKIRLDLNTHIDAFVADIPCIPFKESCNLAFTKITE